MLVRLLFLSTGNVPLAHFGQAWRGDKLHAWRLARTLSRGGLANLDLSYADSNGRTFLHEIFDAPKTNRFRFSYYDRTRWPLRRLFPYLTANVELLQSVDLLAVDSRGYSVIALMRARDVQPEWIAAVEKLFRHWQFWRGSATKSVAHCDSAVARASSHRRVGRSFTPFCCSIVCTDASSAII